MQLASKRNLRRRGCGEKRRFKDMNEALRSRHDPELRAYLCPFGRDHWHLGHRAAGEQPGVNARRW